MVEDFKTGDPVHERILLERPYAVRQVEIYDQTGRMVRTKDKITGVFCPLKRRGETLSVRLPGGACGLVLFVFAWLAPCA